MGYVMFTAVKISASAISTVASATLATMIVRSGEKLRKPFRRIIFGICISDVCSSGAVFVASLSISPDEFGFIENQWACDFDATVFMYGLLGAVSYTMALCLYYLSAVKYKLSDQEFARKIERKVHVGAVVVPGLLCSLFTSMELFNPLPEQNFCFVNHLPPGCHTDPDIECIRGTNAQWYGTYLVILPFLLILSGMLIALSMLCWSVISQERSRTNIFRASFLINDVVDARGANSSDSERTSIRRSINSSVRGGASSIRSFISSIRSNNESSSTPQTYMTRGAIRARERTRETLQQAFLYVGLLLLLYSGSVVVFIAYYWKGKDPPAAFSIFNQALFPLRGLLTTVVLTRPFVQTVRKRRPTYSWFRAFWEVLKAGAEVPAHIESVRGIRRRGLQTSCLGQGRAGNPGRIDSTTPRSQAESRQNRVSLRIFGRKTMNNQEPENQSGHSRNTPSSSSMSSSFLFPIPTAPPSRAARSLDEEPSEENGTNEVSIKDIRRRVSFIESNTNTTVKRMRREDFLMLLEECDESDPKESTSTISSTDFSPSLRAKEAETLLVGYDEESTPWCK